MNENILLETGTDGRLEIIFRQLLDLYERQTNERKLLLQEKEELTRLIQLLVSQTKEIGQYENGIRKRIQDCIKDSASIAMNDIKKSIVEKNNDYLYFPIKQLNEVCKKMEVTATTISGAPNDKLSWRVLLPIIISTIIANLLAVWFLISKPSVSLSHEAIAISEKGNMYG